MLFRSTVISKLPTGVNNELEIWKYSRYFDNPQFSNNPGCEEEPVPDQIEMYNLTVDPIEAQNLANSEFSTPESAAIQNVLAKLLSVECKNKRIYPTNGDVPGKPSCEDCTPPFSV